MYIVSKCLQAENVSLIVAGNHILTLVMMLVLMKYNTRSARPHRSTLALIQYVAGKEMLRGKISWLMYLLSCKNYSQSLY